MKRSKRPSFFLKENCSTILDSKQMSQSNEDLELSDNEDCVVFEGPQKLSVFLPNQVVVVMDLLEETKVFKQSKEPKRNVLQSERRNWKMRPSSFF
jgi:hypothetical protein